MFKNDNGYMSMTGIILTVTVSAVAILVGFVILGNMDTHIEDLAPEIDDSVLFDSVGTVLTNSGTAFSFLALGLFVLAAIFIIGIIAGVLGKSE